MQLAVANKDFPVALVSDDGKSFKNYQVSNGDVLTLLSDRMKGVTISGSLSYSCVMIMGGYLVGIEGQLVFVNEGLLEVSQ
jgi:hypothetical protein